ncbi:hypothetical protein Hamer_G011519, partial [Homarus americanus]
MRDGTFTVTASAPCLALPVPHLRPTDHNPTQVYTALHYQSSFFETTEDSKSTACDKVLHSKIGESFTFFLVTISACIFVVCLLTFCYIISANSFQLIRSSVLQQQPN